MPSSSLASPTAENAQKLKEAQLKIGMALKNAQYALTAHAHRSLTTALHENVNALTALSKYLSLSGSPVKAAAIAGQMAKILRSVSAYVAAKERSGGGWQRAEGSHHSSSPNTSPSSSVMLHELGCMPDSPRESAGIVADLQRAVEELKEQRDMMAEEKRALKAALEESRQHPVTTTPCAVVEAHSAEVADKDAGAAIRELRAELDSLKHELREERTRAAALQDQLHEAEEQVEDQQDQVQALRLQLKLSQEEKLSQDAAFAKKEEEIKALQVALLQNSHSTSSPSSALAAAKDASAAAQPPRGYVDKDDFDALRLQNQLLQQALRAQETQARPTNSQAVLTQQTLEEIEADHQQQLEAMKLTIQNQYNRETELLGQQHAMQDSIDDLKRQLQLSSNRQWVQQEREQHESRVAELQQQLETERDRAAASVSAVEERESALQQRLAELRTSMTAEREQHESRVAELQQQLETERDRAAASVSAVEERESALQQRLAELRTSMTAEREQHESRVAELQQQLETERDRAAATQSTVEERESVLQQRLAELRTSMTAEREQHESRVAELQQQLETERDRAAASQSTVEERESVLQQRLAELRTSMTAEREQHESRVAELQQQLETERDRAAASQSTVEERESVLQQRLAELRTSMTAEREQHESRVAELQQQLETERDRAAASQSTVEERESVLQQRLAELRTSMTAEREQHESRVAELQQQLETERDRAAASQSTVEERESVLQQRLAELRTSMTAEREQHESRVAELQQQLETERDRAAASQSTVEERESVLQQRLAELRTSMTAEREQHESRVAELQQQLETERDRAAASQSTVEERESVLQQRLAELRTSMTAEREQHESRVAELQQQLETERDRAAASQSTVEERESVLQQRLAELRTSMTAEREQHESRVAEFERRVAQLEATQKAENEVHGVAEADLRAQVDAEHMRADMAEVDAREKVRSAAEDSKVFAEAQAAVVEKLKDDHTAELKRVYCESATKFAVASQPVDWLKEENVALKVQVNEWEERHKEEAKEKMAALAKVRETEQILSSRKGELQRLKDECASMQKSMAKSMEERDAAVEKLKDGFELAEEAQANVVRLETLRKELDEVQKRLDTADKDKALLASRYKRASTEKEECADAARKLLAQYKEMASTHEKLVAQLAAAEALAAEKSRVAEELTRAAAVDADLTNNGLQDDAVMAGAQKVLEDTVSEKQERIEGLVAVIDGTARENKRLKSELGNAQARQVSTYRLSLTAEPTSMQPAFARDMLSSLAEMRAILSAMHAQLLPILEQRCVQERSRAAAAASPSASTSAVEALEELHMATESAHAATQATLEHFDAMARQLCVSADLQGVVYGKLLATLQQPQGKSAAPALTSPLVDVSLVRACAALFSEACSCPAPRWEENVRHGAKKSASPANQSDRSDKACSAVRGCAVAAEKDERVTASTAADRKSLPTWSHCRAFSSAPTVFASPAVAGNRDTSACTLSPARRRTDDCEFGMLSDAGYRRPPTRAGPQRRSSFGNFAVAQATISLAEERAGLRTAPTPPWK
ncbi:hypothetical protein, unknown function [Leishmania infantum JPCM5]|uniref:Uncharacterized protein n=2 Tax=Leishmania infantum TaxID=5671 RepID=A4I845_LEIIN|nr:hypothetical protein, unknown function [Leishmania infantum JPCM5]CAC9525945.1 hypothetical_protein_-_conserved [Leishmania infantum]CAM70985.1 hypothetical protein, unknown function [Leishmania infantum JPCM5]SUZ44800.1 hypothetical_protein_-_conserved [Leishmania infantum]|eukprot:XP_001467914.1 hypothetical protein, unknown function [Leishmania infantum JPCM5]